MKRNTKHFKNCLVFQGGGCKALAFERKFILLINHLRRDSLTVNLDWLRFLCDQQCTELINIHALPDLDNLGQHNLPLAKRVKSYD